jgi:hypothetical protein
MPASLMAFNWMISAPTKLTTMRGAAAQSGVD